MGQCFETKLKGVVDNNTLLKLGHYRATFKGSIFATPISSTFITEVNLVSKTGNIRVFNDSTEQEMGFPFVANSGVLFRIEADSLDVEYVLDFNDKYTTDYIGFALRFAKSGSVALKELCNFPKLTQIVGQGGEYALSFNTDEEYSNGTVLQNITYVGLRSKGVTGNLRYIPLIFPNLQSIILYESRLVGSIEDFVRVWRSVGKTSGTIELKNLVRKSDITFNGHTLESSEYDNSTLSWTSTTITLGGETIEYV